MSNATKNRKSMHLEVKKHSKLKFFICSLLLIAAAVSCFFIFKPKFAEGTYYGSCDISGLSVSKALPLAQAEIEKTLMNTKVSVRFAKGADDPTAETVSVLGKSLTYSAELEDYLKAAIKEKQAQHLIPEFEVAADAIVSQLSPAAARYKSEPQDAKVSGFDPESVKLIIDHAISGYTADVEATAQAVAKAIEAGKSTEIDIIALETKATIEDEDLNADYVLLSTYSSTSTSTVNGNHNMELALKKISGTILKPGEVFSYNEKLGDSTTAQSGFLPAHIIVNGVLTDGYGGGICQPSSTLYIAALYAGMEITERYCHSMPSSYVPIGLDATVSYGSLDFKFKNVLDYPVYIYGNMSGSKVTTSIYGVLPDDWDQIRVTSSCDETIAKPSQAVYIVDSNLAKDDFVLVTKGYAGYRASAKRTYYKDGVEVKTELLPSSYYSNKADTYKVGPGSDTSKIAG